MFLCSPVCSAVSDCLRDSCALQVSILLLLLCVPFVTVWNSVNIWQPLAQPLVRSLSLKGIRNLNCTSNTTIVFGPEQ